MNGYTLFRAAGVSFIIASLALIAMTITGCTGPKPTVQDADMELARANAKTECNRARSESDIATVKAIGNLPKEHQGMAMMGFSMSKQTEHLSSKDPCGQGMNFNEARTEIAKSQNKAVEKGMEVAEGVTVPVATVVEMGKTAREVSRTAGNHTTNNTNGNNNSLTHTNTQTTANTQNEVSADGEGASPSVSNGSVTGPDQSSTSETIHEAPAAPVVAE